MIEVRRMAPPDHAQLLGWANLFDALDSEALATFLASPTDHLLVGFVEGQAAGFLLAHELRRLDGLWPKMFIYEVGTEPEFQRLGVGRALIEHCLGLARARGCRGVFVATHASNSAAVALYQATGAVRVAPDDAIFEYVL